VRLEGLGKLKKFIHLIGSRTRDFPACSLVPLPLPYRVLPTRIALFFFLHVAQRLNQLRLPRAPESCT
jgi:hypothetical protein